MSWIIRSRTTPISVLRFGIRRETSDLQKTRIIEFAFQRGEDGVESLDVPDLEHAGTVRSELGKRAGVSRCVSDGLFHKKVLAAFQEQGADLVVGDGGRADRRGVHELRKLLQ